MVRLRLLLLLALFSPSLALGAELRGQVLGDARGVYLRTESGLVPLAPGLPTDQVRVFAGRALEVVLEGEPLGRGFHPSRLLQPTREQVPGTLQQADGQAWSLDGQAVLEAPTGVLELGRGQRVLADAWRFPQGLWVLGLEAETRGDLTILYRSTERFSLPSGYVRSRRTVWLVGTQGDWRQLRYGDDVGWTHADSVDLLPPPCECDASAAPAAPQGPQQPPPERGGGMTDLVPIPGGD